MISSSDIQRLPSVVRFFDQVASRLAGGVGAEFSVQRRSAVILVPDGIDPLDIGDPMRQELERRQVRVDLISLADYPQHTPFASLSAHFELSTVPASCHEFVAAAGDNLPEVLFVEGIAQSDEQQAAAWARLIEQWCQIAHQRANQGHLLGGLCVVAPGRCIAHQLVPAHHLFLDIHYWWGMPTPGETQFLWRELAIGVENVHLSRWREHILPTLAAGDSSLLSDLLYCQGHTTEVIACLDQFAQARGWTQQQLREAGGEKLAGGVQRQRLQMRPGAAEEPLWNMSALVLTPEYGIELHPAALRPLGLHDELDHRLWRAQAGLLLPVIDRVRRKLCDALVKHCGRDWAWRYAEPEDAQEAALVRSNPMLCGLGHLAYLLHPKGVLQKHSDWYSLATQARDLRNRIAHYQLVTLEEYLGLMQTIDQTSWRG